MFQFGEQGTGRIFVTGIATQREQRIRCERDEAFQCKTSGDVFDMRVETAVLVHHQHHRQRAIGLGGLHQVTAGRAVALRRREFHMACRQAHVIRCDLLCGGKLRRECGQDAGCTCAAHGKPCGTQQETATVDIAMHVLVEQPHHGGVEIVGGGTGQLGHGRLQVRRISKTVGKGASRKTTQ